MMFRKSIFILVCFGSLLNAVDLNTTNNIANPFPAPTLVEKDMAKESNSSDASEWNIADFKKHYENNGLNEGVIGNTNTFMNEGAKGKLSTSQNPNYMTTDSLNNNKDLNNSDWLSWDDSMRDIIVNNALKNVNVSLLSQGETRISCFMARDIAFQWQCSKNGLIFGGEMESDGKTARLKCEHECYEQAMCVSVQDTFNATNSFKQTNASWKGTVSKDTNASFTISVPDKRILSSISIELPMQYKNIGLTLQYVQNGKTQHALNALNLETIDANSTIPINMQLSSFKLIFNALNKDANSSKDINGTEVSITSISLNHVQDKKFICPDLQDVKDSQIILGHQCNGGKTTSFSSVNGNHYELCSTDSLKGNNPDGTFSDEASCNASCKISFGCKPNYTTMTTNTLEQFREACMVDVENVMCSDTTEDCKVARLTKAPILNEVVFNAGPKGINSVTDGVQIEGVRRPRVEPNETLSFERKKQEEWKDGAFRNMAQYSKYNETNSSIGDKTEAQYAYRYRIGAGISVGLPGANNASVRGISWLLKPNALDANNGIKKYFYSILKVRFGYNSYDINGDKLKKFKDIWYLKTTKNNDSLLPIRYIDEVAYLGTIDGNVTFSNNQNAKIQDVTFSGESWIPFNPSQKAQYFDSSTLDGNSTGGLPYWEIPIIYNTGLITKNLIGMVTSRDPLPKNTPHYNTNIDGTGDGMLYFEIYTYYSDEEKTFNDLYDLIEKEEMRKIYKSTEALLSKTTIYGDSYQNKDINIFRYGSAENTTVYTQIYPKKDDIGKKGYIFVFIQ